jgi:hypothetical protein
MFAQTSLNMPGFSLTLLLLPRDHEKFTAKQILECLDGPTSAPGWPWHAPVEPNLDMEPQDVEIPKPLALDSESRPSLRCGHAFPLSSGSRLIRIRFAVQRKTQTRLSVRFVEQRRAWSRPNQ